MHLKKLVCFTTILLLPVLFYIQTVSACVTDPYEPYNGFWQLESDDAVFSYSVYSPVDSGVMILSTTDGEELYRFDITEKTYPDFTELKVPKVIDISFTVEASPVEYTFYDGGWYTGLQLLSEDHLTKYGLVKIKSMVPTDVPIPGAVWLLGAGLAGLVALRAKKS